MYCHNCSKVLERDMQFCPFCGVKIIVDKPSALAIPQKPQTNKISVPLLGKQIQFENSIEIYIALRQAFEELGEDIRADFAEDFYSNYRDMDDLMKRLDSDINELMNEGLNEIISFLSEVNIYGVTNKEMANYLQKYCFRTAGVVAEIEEQYDAILAQQEGMRDYRQARKDSRGRVIGGGFGISGAVKGMATAGAINMATGALHSLGNALGNMGSAISASSAKSKLFNEGNIPYYLSCALRDDISAMHLVVVDLLNAYGGKSICKYTPDNTIRADKIYSDLKNSVIPRYNQEDAVITMLSTDPFAYTSYKLMVELFPGRIEEMREFAKFFGFDIDMIYGELRAQVDPAVNILWEYKDYLGNLLANELGLKSDAVEPLTTDLEDMLEYFSDIFYSAEEIGFIFLPESNDVGRSRLNAVKSNYAHFGNEKPLLIYDSTLSKCGKNGFLITEKNIYVKEGPTAYVLSLSDALRGGIQQNVGDNGCVYLHFGAYKVHLLHAGDIIKNELTVDFIELIICLVLFLSSIHMDSNDLWAAIAQYRALPLPKDSFPKHESSGEPAIESRAETKRYCFECGAENDSTAEFCFECGASLT